MVEGQYDDFKVIVGSYQQNGRGFTTIDRDNDVLSTNCAVDYNGGGFWFTNCFHINFNGKYDAIVDYQGIIWQQWTQGENLQKSKMMFRRKV